MEKRLANSTENNNSRRFANYIKSKTKTRISVGPLKDQEGKLVTDELEMAKTLHKFFSEVFTEEDVVNMPAKIQYPWKVLTALYILITFVLFKIHPSNFLCC